MKIASVADVKAHFSAYLKSSEDGPVVVTKNGKPVAVLVSVEDEDEVERLVLAYSPKFRAIIEAAKEQIRAGKGIRHEDFWREVEQVQDLLQSGQGESLPDPRVRPLLVSTRR